MRILSTLRIYISADKSRHKMTQTKRLHIYTCFESLRLAYNGGNTKSTGLLQSVRGRRCIAVGVFDIITTQGLKEMLWYKLNT